MTMSRRELEELLEAYALDLLDEETGRRVEHSLSDHRDLSDHVDQLRRNLSALAIGETTAPPSSLRRSALDAALGRRAPGLGIEGVEPAHPVDAYRQTALALVATLDELNLDEFDAMTVYQRRVVDLVAHLCAVEAYCGHVLGLTPFDGDPSVGHVQLIDETVDRTDPATVVARWRERSTLVVDRAASLTPVELDAPIEFHGLSMSSGQLLVARAFEIWTHTEDIEAAIGRSPTLPSPPVLRAMADLAAAVIGALFDRPDGPQVRITLTGSGGGSWLVPAPPDGQLDRGEESAALLVADVADFCRYVAGRLESVDSFEAFTSGDEDLLGEVLRLAPSLSDFGDPSSIALFRT